MQTSGSGTKETSFYTAIDNLLDGVGDTLRPKVRCVMQLKSRGVGNRDGGLFTADQFDRDIESPKSDFATGRPLLQDLFSLIKTSLEPQQRLGLERVATATGAAYWRIK